MAEVGEGAGGVTRGPLTDRVLERVSLWGLVEAYQYELHVWPPRPGIARWTMIASSSGTLPPARNEAPTFQGCVSGLRSKIVEEARRLA